MIVSCPSCSTRYRHHQDPVIPAAMGRCSRCDETMPLVEAKRGYVLIPGGRAADPMMGIGVDDPQLTPQIRAVAEAPQADASRLPEPSFEAPVPEHETPAEVEGPTRNPYRELPLIALLAGLGGVGGYYALQGGADTAKLVAMSAGAGLVLVWAWWLWAVRKH